MSDLVLKVSGQKYGGWTSVSVTQSLEQLAHSFRVSYAKTFEELIEIVAINEGDACEIEYGDNLITGYVDTAPRSYTDTSFALAVSGRSKTCDLVDCSAIHKGGQWRNRTLLQIAIDLCDPFGIDVSADVALGDPFRRFSIQEGETVHECLERAARYRGVLLQTDSDGNLVFTRAGETCAERVNTVLEYGVNVLRGSREGDYKERHSKYILKNQIAGDDNTSGSAAASIQKTAEDDAVGRYRPLIIIAEEQETGQALQDRANWERNIRAGRSQRLNYAFQGWEHDDGLWKRNTLVKVKDAELDVDEELLIVSVTYELSERGKLAQLELTFKEAFDVLTLPEPTYKKGKRQLR